jgi:methyl-accepting chemotaxis protein
MTTGKNKLMIWLTWGTVCLSLLFHLLFRVFNLSVAAFFGLIHAGGTHPSYFDNQALILNVIMMIPVLLAASSTLLQYLARNPIAISYLNGVSLTFASISIIAGTGGSLEFHFSIFMVLAMAAYYEKIGIILAMTGIFAVQHLAGFAWAPTFVFGSSEYPFAMVLIHAIFLILTSAATIVQIQYSRKQSSFLQKEKEARDAVIVSTMRKLQATSSSLHESTGSLEASSKEMLKANEQIASGVDALASDVGKQRLSVEETARAVQEMVVGVSRIAESAGDVSEESAAMAKDAQTGKERMEEAVQDLRELNAGSASIVQSISLLRDHADNIGEMATVISAIASQTNLLALNAAIEAARAGEEGRGFAVVASEVRKLANQSEASAKQIAELIEAIQHSTRQTAEQVDAAISRTNRAAQAADEAGAVFVSIVSSSRSVADSIHDITASAEQLSAGTEEMAASLEEMVTRTVRSADGSQAAAEASVGQLGSLRTVAESVRQLSRLSEETAGLTAELAKMNS